MFKETNVAVVAPLEGAGYCLPDRLMPDISVGLGFSKHLEQKGIDLNDPRVRVRYKLRIPLLEHPGQWRNIEPWQYTNDLLGEYRNYTELVWWPKQALGYFRDKDPEALPNVHQYLGLPYYQQLSLSAVNTSVAF